jgi:2-dehydro-3-deoxyphosphogluconate aldolase/(4S)-4-hydroxy-2-oxoglutarate aldolase
MNLATIRLSLCHSHAPTSNRFFRGWDDSFLLQSDQRQNSVHWKMSATQILGRLVQKRIVPVAVIDNAAQAVPLAKSLLSGGLGVVEITFRTADAEEAIRQICVELPQVLVGAGTILEPAQVQRAINAGAKFGVSPGMNDSVVRSANDLNWPFVPGVMTPSDVESALQLDCKLQKFFPAEVAGGVPMVKALAGPYIHAGVKFIPLGGVNAQNAADYLALPNVAAIGGSWICERKLIAAGDWKAISRLAGEAVALAAATR